MSFLEIQRDTGPYIKISENHSILANRHKNQRKKWRGKIGRLRERERERKREREGERERERKTK